VSWGKHYVVQQVVATIVVKGGKSLSHSPLVPLPFRRENLHQGKSDLGKGDLVYSFGN